MLRKALSFKPRFKRLILLALNGILEPLGYKIVHRTRLVDFYLHSYGSYDEYRDVQVFHNKRKLDSVWSDETTLGVICDELQRLFPDRSLNGLCHGTRNGFEQRFFFSNRLDITSLEPRSPIPPAVLKIPFNGIFTMSIPTGSPNSTLCIRILSIRPGVRAPH